MSSENSNNITMSSENNLSLSEVCDFRPLKFEICTVAPVYYFFSIAIECGVLIYLHWILLVNPVFQILRIISDLLFPCINYTDKNVLKYPVYHCRYFPLYSLSFCFTYLRQC